MVRKLEGTSFCRSIAGNTVGRAKAKTIRLIKVAARSMAGSTPRNAESEKTQLPRCGSTTARQRPLAPAAAEAMQTAI